MSHIQHCFIIKPSNNTVHACMGTVHIHQEWKSILSASYGVEMVQLSRTCKLNNFLISIIVYQNQISFVLALHTFCNHIILINCIIQSYLFELLLLLNLQLTGRVLVNICVKPNIIYLLL